VKFRFITVFIFLSLLAGFSSAAEVSFDFSQGNLNTDEYLAVTFTGSISGADAADDSQWVWNFGDGSIPGYGKTVTHTYSEDSLPFDMSTPIEFMIALDVRADEEDGGGKVSTSRKITLNEPPLLATFTANATSGTSPLAVTFTDTTHGRHRILEWDFADLSDKPAISPVTHVFETDRTYPVKLTVGRGQGEVSTTGKEIVVRKPGPVVSFKSDVSSGRAPLVVMFTDNSKIDSGEITGWSWDFGDSTPLSTIQNPKHVFEKPGNYTVVLTVTGNDKTGSDKITIFVKNLEVSFYADKTSGTESLSVNFTSNSKGDITSYYWNFGDGYFSTEENPVHIFYNTGIYDVSLTIAGPDGSDMQTSFGYIEVLGAESLNVSEDDMPDTGLLIKDSIVPPPKEKMIFGISGTELILKEIEKLQNFFRELFSFTRQTGESLGENLNNSAGLFSEE
jgi:PKD repeat protein